MMNVRATICDGFVKAGSIIWNKKMIINDNNNENPSIDMGKTAYRHNRPRISSISR